MTDGFVSLHNHSDFSPLDGAAKVDTYFARAAELEQVAFAVTDHGSMSGHWEAWNAGKKHGVKPILGIEAYIAPQDLRHKKPVQWGTPEQKRLDVGGSGKATHMTMLALNTTGLQNLYRMQYVAATEGFYGYPRYDMELMAQHSEGILVTSGCAGSAISTRIRLGQRMKAYELADQLHSIYGENFFIEVMDHGIAEDDLNDYDLNVELVGLANKLGIPLVATNDAHYCTEEDASGHDAFLCLQTRSKLDDEKRFRFNGSGYHLKSAAEMERTLRDVPAEAISNTLLIAERVEAYDAHFEFRNRMPHLPGVDPDFEGEYLQHLVDESYAKEGRAPSREEKGRDDYELSVINSMGFPGYFIVLADIINWAKGRSIRVGPGRGSAGGSHVCYRIGITGINPLVHGLPFERFLNPERVSLPDIDIDFEITRRAEVVEYVRERFGEKNVVKILTLGTIGAKAAIKDAGGVLGHDFATTNQLTKLFPPPIHGFNADLYSVFDRSNKRYSDAKHLRAEIEANPEYRKIYDLALKIVGLIRNFGVHAAGVIISSEELDSIIPLRLPTGKDKEDDADLVTGFDQNAMEPMGLIKYDFLGLENLTTLTRAEEFIQAIYGETIRAEDLPLTDAATYTMLAEGNALGVFQLDSPGMRKLLKRLKPRRFEDISAVLALYRPGPMGVDAHNSFADRANGKEQVTAIHSEFEGEVAESLAETHGVIVYQEQIMSVLQLVAGYTPGQADMVRRIMGKKKPAEMAKLEPELREKMKAKGYSDDAFEALWEILVPFADYSFNKAHTAAYGLISYWTAYYKRHYPIAYFAALLSAEADDQEKLTAYLADARDNGVNILPPDLNESDYGFTPTKEGIRFGLSAIKGVGESVITEYAEGGVNSLNDFYINISEKVNSRTLQCLIQAGALDAFGDRVEHSERSGDWLTRAKDTRKALAHGDQPLILGGYSLPSDQTDKPQMREWEKELLGTALTLQAITAQMERPLTDQEWAWVADLLEKHTGSERVKFVLDGVAFNSGQTVSPSGKLISMLNALRILKVSLD